MDTTKNIQTWKFTRKQFDWLVDIIENKTPYTNSFSVRQKASELLREHGWRGWYDIEGRLELVALRQVYIDDVKHKETHGMHDLPF